MAAMAPARQSTVAPQARTTAAQHATIGAGSLAGANSPCQVKASIGGTSGGAAMTPAHFAAAGLAPDTPVMGIEGGRELFRVLLRQDKAELDTAAAKRDIPDAGRALVAAHPEMGAIVLECTSMPPHATALQVEPGLPAHDVLSLASFLFAGLRSRRYG